MRLQQILSEKVLFSEFKFGFELEAIKSSPELKELVYNAVNTEELDPEFFNHYEDIASRERESLSQLFNSFFGFPEEEGNKVKMDSSLKSNIVKVHKYEPDADVTFEWATPVMNFSPENISKSISFLSKLPDWGIETNSSCGFHIHISYPNLSVQDAAWIVVSVALDKNIRQLLSKFGEFNFVNHYANDEYLDQIKKYLDTNQNGRLRALLSNEKYRLLRIHPQGTLEWRGPRDFLSKTEITVIKQFFNTLIDFVKWISNTLSAPSVNGLTRDHFNKIFGYTRTEFGPQKNRSDMWAEWMDNRDIQNVLKIAPWLLNARFKNADIIIRNNMIVWRMGEWLDGEWKNGRWVNGDWHNGVWVNGTWKSGKWHNGTWYNGTWDDGIWHTGIWHNGLWKNGVWAGGSWKKGQRLKYTTHIPFEW